MDQMKIGAFLKKLRKEKNLTQEQLAEQFNVSGRTVSRWETGINMPDISILVNLAEFYNVGIPEIIDGERKGEKMNEEVKEKVIGNEQPITCRPADLLEPELDKLKSEMEIWSEQEEDVLSYALFPQVAMDYFKYRAAQEDGIDPKLGDKENGTYPV